MATKKRNLQKLVEYWTADRGLGNKPRIWWLIDWITLAPLWKWLGKKIRRSFDFDIPEWAKGVQQLTFDPTKKIRWHNYFNPVFWIGWIFDFLIKWLVSRPYVTLGPSLPAVIIGLGLGIFSLRQYMEQADWRGEMYRNILAQAVSSKDDALARLALTHLISKFPNQTEYRFQQALLDEKNGNHVAALRSMLSLATSRGDSAAAFWVVRQQFALQEVASWPPEKHQQFRQLMQIALRDAQGPSEVVGRTLMASYLMSVGAPNDAIQNLISVSGKNNELYIAIANLYFQLGDYANKKVWAEKALQYYEGRLLASPADKAARIELAKALLLLEREEDAAKRLSQGYMITKDPQLAEAGGEALATWAMRIRESEPASEANLVRQIQLLTRAASLAPRNPVVVELVVQIAIECADDKRGQVAAVRNAMLKGFDAENMHFIQGTVALLQGKIEEADAHLKLAAKNTNELPGVLNNMAVVLYQKKEPDYDRALELVNAAIARMDHPYFRETRGQILVKLKRFDDAVLDLEAALKAPDLAEPVHSALAIAYDELGQSTLADLHRQLALASKKK